MKTTNLIKYALFAAVLAAFSLVGCEGLDSYSIDAPKDLQNRIDSIADAAKRKQEIADSIAAAEAAKLEARLIDDLYQVGVTDNTTGFWGGHSKYYRLATNDDTVYVKFKNFGSGANVYNNWVQAITNDVARGGTGYVEYAIWRADNWNNFAWGTENGTGWGTDLDGDSHASQQTTNYSTYAVDQEDAEFSNWMNGADCVASITRGGDSVYVNVTMTALSGKVLKKSWYVVENGLEDQPVRIFWTVDGSHLVFYKTLFEPLDEFAPDFELDPNWDNESVEEIEDGDAETTYRADITATSTATDGTVITQTFFAEGLPYAGYGTFLVPDGSYFVLDPTETYYSALADKDNAGLRLSPYSEETTVGATDFSSGFWTVWSDYTTVVGEAYFHYKFVNNGSQVNRWNNWVIVVTNGQVRGGSSYKECFVIRADKAGWGEYYDAGHLENDYAGFVGQDIESSSFDWAPFLSLMNGATVEIEVKISAETTTSETSFSKALKPGETLN